MAATRADAIVGCLLGAALGDALGLWCEGLTPRRQQRLHADLTTYHFLFGQGMVSDDTEHLCMTAQALIVSAGDPRRFRQSLAWRLRFWLLGLPAGVGKATARAIVKLWLGGRRGVFSAGNGPAMRSSILGVCFGSQPERLRELVRASTELTHTDPKAEYGALAIAWAAHVSHASSEEADLARRFLEGLRDLSGPAGADFLQLAEHAVRSAQTGQETTDFARELGLANGVSGYTYHSVPVVLQAWLRRPSDLELAMNAVLRCGGDTDTTAALLGGILGARVGMAGLPSKWLAGLCEWPRSASWIERVGRQLELTLNAGKPQRPVRLFVPGLLVRNVVFLIVVLLHGFRRLLPPY